MWQQYPISFMWSNKLLLIIFIIVISIKFYYSQHCGSYSQPHLCDQATLCRVRSTDGVSFNLYLFLLFNLLIFVYHYTTILSKLYCMFKIVLNKLVSLFIVLMMFIILDVYFNLFCVFILFFTILLFWKALTKLSFW